MRTFNGSGKVLRVAVVALLVVMAMPATSLAQRGRGRGRGGRDFDRSDRKCDKFVNCHDARDGRWDGRGPRRRSDERRFRRFRDRDFDNDDFRRRRRFRDRDFDDDDFRRLQRRRILIDQYRNNRYDNYNYNPYYNQRGFNWTDLLYLFLQ